MYIGGKLAEFYRKDYSAESSKPAQSHFDFLDTETQNHVALKRSALRSQDMFVDTDNQIKPTIRDREFPWLTVDEANALRASWYEEDKARKSRRAAPAPTPRRKKLF